MEGWGDRHAATPILLCIGIRLFSILIPVISLIKLVHAYRTDTMGKGQIGAGLKKPVHIIPESFIIPDFFAM